MGNILLYATKHDADSIRQWINNEPDVAWIVKVGEQDDICHWKAVNAIDELQEQTYALWHAGGGHIEIRSGSDIPDMVISDPFAGWSGKSLRGGATYPWFANTPKPYFFAFRETGREAPGSLGRSDLTWNGDHFKTMGLPAHPEAKRWWQKLQRFVKKSTVAVPWATLSKGKSPNAYLFPEAKLQIDRGRHRDVNR